MPFDPKSVERTRRTESSRSIKLQQQPIAKFAPAIASPNDYRAILMLLGVINVGANSEESDRGEEIKKNALQILDHPENLVLVENEADKSQFPFATDLKQTPLRTKRLVIKNLLLLAPSFADQITGFLSIDSSPQVSKTQVTASDQFSANQIENAFNQVIASDQLPEIIREFRKNYSPSGNQTLVEKASEEKQIVSDFLDIVEDKAVRVLADSFIEESVMRGRAKSGSDHKEFSSSQKRIDINEFKEYRNQRRQSGYEKLPEDVKFANGTFVGEDVCFGMLADLSDSPNLKAKYGYLENGYFGKQNIVQVIRGVDFSGFDFRGLNINIDGIRFEDCNFENAIIPSSENVQFVNSNLQGTDWQGTKQISLAIGAGGPKDSIKFQLLTFSNLFTPEDSEEIKEELNKKIQPFLQESQIINANSANFSGCELISPSFVGVDFKNSNFKKSKITDDGDTNPSIIIKECKNLNLEEVSYELVDYLAEDSQKITSFSGFEKIDLTELKNQCEKIYGKEKADRLFTEFATDGYTPKELLEKLRENKKITIKININPPAIDNYIDDANYLEKRDLDPKTKENLSKNAIRFLSKLFGQYNFEFVDQDSDEVVDYNINIGVASGRAGVSFRQISTGNATIVIGGAESDKEFLPNYQIMAHELLHSLMGFSTFGTHTNNAEPIHEVGMSNLFCGTLTYNQKINFVTQDGKLHEVRFEENFSKDGADYLTSCTFDQNDEFLRYLGRKKIAVERTDLEHVIEKDELSNQICFQQFPEKENKIKIDEELKDSYAISVSPARDAIKFCRLPSIGLCITNQNFKKDEKVIIFTPKQSGLPSKIIFVSGGQKKITIGNEILYSDFSVKSSSQPETTIIANNDDLISSTSSTSQNPDGSTTTKFALDDGLISSTSSTSTSQNPDGSTTTKVALTYTTPPLTKSLTATDTLQQSSSRVLTSSTIENNENGLTTTKNTYSDGSTSINAELAITTQGALLMQSSSKESTSIPQTMTGLSSTISSTQAMTGLSSTIQTPFASSTPITQTITGLSSSTPTIVKNADDSISTTFTNLDGTIAKTTVKSDINAFGTTVTKVALEIISSSTTLSNDHPELITSSTSLGLNNLSSSSSVNFIIETSKGESKEPSTTSVYLAPQDSQIIAPERTAMSLEKTPTLPQDSQIIAPETTPQPSEQASTNLNYLYLLIPLAMAIVFIGKRCTQTSVGPVPGADVHGDIVHAQLDQRLSNAVNRDMEMGDVGSGVENLR